MYIFDVKLVVSLIKYERDSFVLVKMILDHS